jgi:hypothetical protein
VGARSGRAGWWGTGGATTAKYLNDDPMRVESLERGPGVGRLINKLARSTDLDDQQTKCDSFGLGFGPVQNPFGHNPLAPDLEPDHRSGSSPAPNLGPDHGQVRHGSGSNHGSELNLTIPIPSRLQLRTRPLPWQK